MGLASTIKNEYRRRRANRDIESKNQTIVDLINWCAFSIDINTDEKYCRALMEARKYGIRSWRELPEFFDNYHNNIPEEQKIQMQEFIMAHPEYRTERVNTVKEYFGWQDRGD